MKKVNEASEKGLIRFADKDQAFLWKDEILGQLSDGFWENATPGDHWKGWSDAEVAVGQPAGYFGFRPRRTSYGLNNSELLSVVGDRMRIHLGLYRMLGEKAMEMHHHLPDEVGDFKMAEQASKGEHGEYWVKRLEEWKAAGITPELVQKAYDTVKGLLFKMMKTMKVALPSAEGGEEKPKEEAPKEEKPAEEAPKEEKPAEKTPEEEKGPSDKELHNPYESKVNEDAGSQDYHKKLWEFLDHPWQEDNEIDLVNMIGQYRGDFKVNPPAPIQDYLKRLVNENGIMGRQGFSDAFMNALQDLMGTKPNEPAKEGEPPMESKTNEKSGGSDMCSKCKKNPATKSGGLCAECAKSEEKNESKKVKESFDFSPENLLVAACNQEHGWAVADQLKHIMDEGDTEDLNPNAVQLIREFLQDAANETEGEMKAMTEELLGRIPGSEEHPEGEEEEPVEPEMEESVDTARRLLGLKEKDKEDEPVKVGDLVQIVDATTYRVEVEEATVKAIDEKKGVEITGSTIPVSQKWYSKPYWFVSKID